MVFTRTVTADTFPADDPARLRGASLSSRALASEMPRLSAEARRAAASVVAGVHGRRRAGTGETFWQFRPFMSGESAARIDWRRSARDQRQLFVREREWEAAQTIWLWIDRSPSMAYRSSLTVASKLERAVVLGLALADMLVRGGERIGLIDLTPPIASRRIIERLSDALLLAPGAGMDMPSSALAPRSEAVLVSDFIMPDALLAQRLRALASRGARGHLVLVRDPAEERFPFAGQTEFVDPEDGYRLRVGAADQFAASYHGRIAAQREAVRRAATAVGWSVTIHATDRPSTEPLMALSALVAQLPTGR